jgi:hypothetical protein
MITSVLAVGLTAETPARAVDSRQESRTQMKVHEKRAVKLVRAKRKRADRKVRKKRMNRRQRNKIAAMPMVARRGWSYRHFHCLDRLWTRESGWNHRAHNSSGAYGIPQALPGGKMRSAGRDWRRNPRTQIKWGLGYIKHRYGSPCGAWRHARASGWY